MVALHSAGSLCLPYLRGILLHFSFLPKADRRWLPELVGETLERLRNALTAALAEGLARTQTASDLVVTNWEMQLRLQQAHMTHCYAARQTPKNPQNLRIFWLAAFGLTRTRRHSYRVGVAT